MMNYMSAKELIKHNVGIFRSAKFNQTFNLRKYASRCKKISKKLNLGGKYSKDFGEHDMLELEAYVHITSPIRRLVDLLNMMILQENLGIQ